MRRSMIPLIILLLLLTACGPSLPTESSTSSVDTAVSQTTQTDTVINEFDSSKYEDLEIITLLPRDAIPAIDEPRFLSVSEADEFYDPNELIIGVSFDGDSRAYSIPLLSNHEIVNDTVGGRKIAVTW